MPGLTIQDPTISVVEALARGLTERDLAGLKSHTAFNPYDTRQTMKVYMRNEVEHLLSMRRYGSAQCQGHDRITHSDAKRDWGLTDVDFGGLWYEHVASPYGYQQLPIRSWNAHINYTEDLRDIEDTWKPEPRKEIIETQRTTHIGNTPTTSESSFTPFTHTYPWTPYSGTLI
ncbi:hypothetical protein FISHEDRAFT_59917 [Fistulina hepatica ATCC 64428]|uniref:Uncharacterized protein n=1 Tax=Fistulina hepatica ATCC 64428 TaxID=1128425 RepID=A0A0D7A8G5_9AGAR|nr:hypothetical protein FISHEDRAFT_59917 [Fistulina hepatica ATCC 64428]